MNCPEVEVRLLEDLEAAYQEILAAHLRRCHLCRSLHADLLGLDQLVGGMRHEVHAPAGFDLRVVERSRNRQVSFLFWKSLAWSSLLLAIVTLAGDRLIRTSPQAIPTAQPAAPAEILWNGGAAGRRLPQISPPAGEHLHGQLDRFALPSPFIGEDLPLRIQTYRKRLHQDSDLIHAVH